MISVPLVTPYRNKKTNFIVIYDRKVILRQKAFNRISWSLILLTLFGFVVNFSLLYLPVYSKPDSIEHITLESSQETPKTSDAQEWLKQNNLPPAADTSFAIIIPKINLNAKVLPDISLTDEKEINEKLKNSVGHARGSSIPGKTGTTYIFGHSTNYPWNRVNHDSLFFHLNNLENQDEIIIVYNNKINRYQVIEKIIVEAQETNYLNYNESEENLVLQTCWPLGTRWKRLLVIANITNI